MSLDKEFCAKLGRLEHLPKLEKEMSDLERAKKNAERLMKELPHLIQPSQTDEDLVTLLIELTSLQERNEALEGELGEAKEELIKYSYTCEMLKNAAIIQVGEQNNWIPVSERLPRKAGWINCIEKNGNIFSTYVMKARDGSIHFMFPDIATHWKPITPPEEKV